MDSIFDEDVDEVGGEIEAYCPSPRCKADTTHTIISMYEDEVRRVQCVVCGDVHAYRKPRGDSAEEPTGVQPGEVPRRRVTKMTWADALSRSSDADLTNCRPYSIRDTYEEGDIVSHPVFDIGMVTELLPDNKVEITFKEGPRILVHNRGDLAPRMPGISEAPPPREQKKKKRAKKKEDAAIIMARPPKDLGEALEMARQAAAAKIEGGPPPKAPAKGKAPAAKPEPAKAAKGAAKAAPVPAKAPPAKAAGKAAAAPAQPAAKTPAKKAAPAAKKPAAKAAKPAPKAAKPAAKKPAPKAKPAAKKPAAKAKPAAKKPAAKKPAPKAKPAKKPAPKAKPAKKKK